MIRRLLTLACATAALTFVAADRAGAQADPKGPAVQPFKPGDLKWVRNATGTQERAVLFGDPSKPEPYVARIKWLPGNMSRPHFHQNDRHFVVISGTWWLGSGEKVRSGLDRSGGTGHLRLPQGEGHPLRRLEERGSDHPGVGHRPRRQHAGREEIG